MRSHKLSQSVNRCDSTCPSDACYKFIKTIDELKDNGYWVAGAEADNATDYRNMAADMPLAIVIGSEGQGMSRLVKDKCDFYIKIPMVGHVNSLNASVAASLMMYEVYRKRHQIGDTQ